MKQYTNLLEEIITDGVTKKDRTGVGTVSIFGTMLKFDLSKGYPAPTTRAVAPRIAIEETLLFLRGSSDTKELEAKRFNIWKGNTTREFLDQRGLTHLPEGDMGRGYGVQWRDWHTYEIIDAEDSVDLSGDNACTMFYNAKVRRCRVDQLANLLDGLKNDPDGRRHIITAWNPGELSQMALPPCHYDQQHYVADGKLHTRWTQRSVDTVYGLPYNIMSYAFLNAVFAKYLGLEQGTLTFHGGDTHIYLNQLDMARDQITREPRPLPTLTILKELNTLDDILSLTYADVSITGYSPHPDYKDKPPMAV